MNVRRAAAALVALEGLAGVVAGVGFVVAALVGDPDNRGDAVILGVLLALLGTGVLLVARGVDRGSGWARTPAYLVQFFGFVVAWNQRHTLLGVTIVLGVVAVAAVSALTAAARREA